MIVRDPRINHILQISNDDILRIVSLGKNEVRCVCLFLVKKALNIYVTPEMDVIFFTEFYIRNMRRMGNIFKMFLYKFKNCFFLFG